jgi:hypothetical protein
VDATVLAMDPQGDIAANYPGFGVWEFDPTRGRFKLTTADASLLAMA